MDWVQYRQRERYYFMSLGLHVYSYYCVEFQRVNSRGVYMRKLTPALISYRDDFFISNLVYMMTGSFHISLFEGTLHVDKIHVWFKIANITHRLPVPVYQKTDFTLKRMVISRLHDTAARFRARVKFSPQYKNWSDSGQHGILWWYHVSKYRAMRGKRSELAPGRNSPWCHVNTPLVPYLHSHPLKFGI